MIDASLAPLTARVTKLEATPAPVPVPVPTPTPTPTGAKLLFADEFDTLDMTTASHVGFWRPNDAWQPLDRGYKDFAGTSWNANPNDTIIFYNPFSVANSILSIKIVKPTAAQQSVMAAQMAANGQSLPVPSWMGGYLVSNPAVKKFKYGYFEFKARWPNAAKGMFPSLWFYATDGSGDPLGKGTAEIDLIEINGIAGIWNTNIHPVQGTVGQANGDTTGWHTYALDWQPTYLKFYRDNILVYTVTGANATYFNTTMGIRMNYGMDAPWFNAAQKSDASTPLVSTMDIDYVRVWDVKP